MDFTHVSDMVEAGFRLMAGDIVNEDFNVAPGKDTSIRELAYKIIEIMELDIEPQFVPRDILVTRRRANSAKLRSMTGFEFQTGLDSGLRELIDHCKANIDLY